MFEEPPFDQPADPTAHERGTAEHHRKARHVPRRPLRHHALDALRKESHLEQACVIACGGPRSQSVDPTDTGSPSPGPVREST